MIEGINQRFTDSITSESCATFCLFLERTLARLPPTLGDVYSAAMIACNETSVRCEKQSSEGSLSVALVFCFRIRSYYAMRQVFAMFNRRFESLPVAKRLSVCCANFAQTQRRACRYCRSVRYRGVELTNFPTHFDAAITNVQLECRLSTTDFDFLTALLDPRLGVRRIRCAVFWR